MSHDATPHAKLIYMANQIAKFMESKPHDEGVAGLSAHINDFWEPRMRRHLFEVLDNGGTLADFQRRCHQLIQEVLS